MGADIRLMRYSGGFAGGSGADLLLEVDERLLAHLNESLTRSVEIDHEGNDRAKDDHQPDGGEGAAPQVRPAL